MWGRFYNILIIASWGGKNKETLVHVLTRETIAVISLHTSKSEVKIKSMLCKLFAWKHTYSFSSNNSSPHDWNYLNRKKIPVDLD